MSRLAAVLVDMDGLLVASEDVWYAAEAAVAARLGAPWGHDHQARLLGGSLENTSSYLAAHGVAHGGAAVAPERIAQELLEEMTTRLSAGVALMPGAARLLRAVDAAGVPRALVSSSRRVLVDAALPSVDAALDGRAFPVTVAGDEVTRTKPDAEPYRTAAARLGVDPRACVVLEDSPPGVAAGEAAGCAVVAVPSLRAIGPGPRRVVVASLEQVDLSLLGALVSAAA